MKTRLIGLYELITGIFGFILSLYTLITNFSGVLNSVSALFSYVLALLLYAGVGYAGYALINGLKGGVKYSIWGQALQIVAFSVNGVQYLFTGAAFLYIRIRNGIGIEYDFQPIDYGIFKTTGLAPDFLHIYILPLVFLLLLLPERK